MKSHFDQKQRTNLNLLATEKRLSVPHLNSQSCLSMSTVSHKTKAFITLDSNLLNHPSTKSMEVAVEFKLVDLHEST